MTHSAVCGSTVRFWRYRYTGKERDAESGFPNGNDYFGARYYASNMGRFMSPDWSAKEEPVPYAKLDDPQSLNLYSYVRNNPLARTDPDGHCCEEVQEWADSTGFEPIIIGAGLLTAGAAAWDNRDAIGSGFMDVAARGSMMGQYGDLSHQASSLPSSAPASQPATGQSTPASPEPEDPQRKNGGANTESKLPGKTIVSEDGVTVEHYTRSGDHGPAHLHVSGNGPNTRIGQNGKPISGGDPTPSSAQQNVIQNNQGAIRKAVDQIMRWFNFNRM